jgi:hypothetical protein
MCTPISISIFFDSFVDLHPCVRVCMQCIWCSEVKSRRLDVAMYALPKAGESFYVSVSKLLFGKHVRVPNADWIMFALALALLGQAYGSHSSTMSPLLRSLFAIMIGKQCQKDVE